MFRRIDPYHRATLLRRLERLVRMRRDYFEDLNPQGVRLLDVGIMATYVDCCDVGAAGAASDILGRVKVKA